HRLARGAAPPAPARGPGVRPGALPVRAGRPRLPAAGAGRRRVGPRPLGRGHAVPPRAPGEGEAGAGPGAPAAPAHRPRLRLPPGPVAGGQVTGRRPTPGAPRGPRRPHLCFGPAVGAPAPAAVGQLEEVLAGEAAVIAMEGAHAAGQLFLLE